MICTVKSDLSHLNAHRINNSQLVTIYYHLNKRQSFTANKTDQTFSFIYKSGPLKKVLKIGNMKLCA